MVVVDLHVEVPSESAAVPAGQTVQLDPSDEKYPIGQGSHPFERKHDDPGLQVAAVHVPKQSAASSCNKAAVATSLR